MDLTDDIIDWANSILITAEVNDPTKDFCDGRWSFNNFKNAV